MYSKQIEFRLNSENIFITTYTVHFIKITDRLVSISIMNLKNRSRKFICGLRATYIYNQVFFHSFTACFTTLI